MISKLDVSIKDFNCQHIAVFNKKK